jgi:hypothetical protein
MKYFKPAALIWLILFGIMLSCVKNTATIEYAASGPNRNLVSLNPVKKGESFDIFPVLPDSNATIRWTIRPSDSTQLSINGNQVTISIFLAGSYVITANFYAPSNTVSPYDSSIYTIIVKDSVSVLPPPQSDYDTLPLEGSQLTLTFISSTNGVLTLHVQTMKDYPCTSYISEYGILQDAFSPTSKLNINFNSGIVAESTTDCTGPAKPAYGTIDLIPLDIGTHSVSVSLNQINYLGTLSVTDSNYTFTWPYSSGVIISPLQIKK